MSRFLFLSLLSSFVLPGNAQQYENLIESKTARIINLYYSEGREQRASAIAERMDKAAPYFDQLLSFKASVTVLVLSPTDWPKYAKTVVYGMPHYNNEKILIVAADDNPFWQSFLPPLDRLPGDLVTKIKNVYSRSDSSLSMERFFDLLAVHELAHAFHMQAGLTMQRNWMGELFVNMLLHTYIAENEPQLVPALTLFPQMVVSGGGKGLNYTTLKDLELNYNEIAVKYPNNYGWYQCRLHSGAAVIYERGGKAISSKLWNALKTEKQKLSDAELLAFLKKSDLKPVAELIENWDLER
ncbi:hypothetical protein [Flavitalea sp.]|nr:hypothetical protein [Flavitalea sp.]